jgi:hypothetical protein
MLPLERAVCDQVKEIRRELQLSQTQLARLLNTSVRTIKRWERYVCKPRRHQRQWLWTLSEYVKNHGPEALRARFLQGEEGRYRKPGPAARLAENVFDSTVA